MRHYNSISTGNGKVTIDGKTYAIPNYKEGDSSSLIISGGKTTINGIPLDDIINAVPQTEKSMPTVSQILYSWVAGLATLAVLYWLNK